MAAVAADAALAATALGADTAPEANAIPSEKQRSPSGKITVAKSAAPHEKVDPGSPNISDDYGSPAARRSRCLPECGFIGYFFVLFSICGICAAGSIALFSSMGKGKDSLKWLEEQEGWWSICVGLMMAIFLLLWLLDYFQPPHYPGKRFLLFHGDRIVGPALLLTGILCFLAACLLASKDYPFNPVMVTVFLCPVLLACSRKILKPRSDVSDTLGKDAMSKHEIRKLEVLNAVTSEEVDQRNFYRAALASLVTASVCCLGVWLIWALHEGQGLDAKLKSNDDAADEREVRYILWSTPLIVSVSFMTFALMVLLRVCLDRSYNDSCQIKTWAMKRSTTITLGVEWEDLDSFQSVGTHAAAVENAVRSAVAERVDDIAKGQHSARLMQVSQILKFVGCALLFMIGSLYVTFQLVAADSHIALMVQGFLGAIFVLFLCFVHLSFKRLWDVMSTWLLELPLWQKALQMAESNVMKAVLIGIFLPISPFFLILTMMTQCVRRCRGLHNRKSSNSCSSNQTAALSNGTSAASVESIPVAKGQRTSLVTARVQKQLAAMSKWNWLSIVWWLYFWSLAYLTLTICPRLLNVFLAVMKEALKRTSFGLLCVYMFGIGLGLFLIPVVPGAPIFFFSGALLPDKCDAGFWWGAAVAIILGTVLKLTACATQQKLIGEQLGSFAWVRQTVGVHKPMIRTIEVVLRKPGLSVGKVAILCGGPDWPTSVLAGILKCSLPQMLLGTLPIILFVAPFSLSGTFYLKRNDGDVWDRSANLMFTATGIVCVVLWAIVAWAVETEFERSHEEVTCPRPEYLELEWKDHCSNVIALQCDVTWPKLPCMVRFAYASGAVGLVLVCHSFWWGATSCFGNFAPTDAMKDLEWYGENELSIIKFNGLMGLLVATASCFGILIFRIWVKVTFRKSMRNGFLELRNAEASWKEQRQQYVSEIPEIAYRSSQASRISGVSVNSGDFTAMQSDLSKLDRSAVDKTVDTDLTLVEAKSDQDPSTDSYQPADRDKSLELVRAQAASADVPEGPSISPDAERRMEDGRACLPHEVASPTRTDPSEG